MKLALKFSDKIYTGEGLKNHIFFVKWRLKNLLFLKGIYLLLLPENNTCQLEIMEASFLNQQYYRNNPPTICGYCASYNEAIGLVVQIAEESLKMTGAVDLRRCFKV